MVAAFKRRITITDKKGIGELKLLGKWDIHTYPVKSIKRVRLVRRANGYLGQPRHEQVLSMIKESPSL